MDERKLILFDMDGTLIDWRKQLNQPSPEFFKILETLKQHNYLIMIASGRLLPLITKPLNHYHFDGYILSDGAHVIFNNKEMIYEPLEDQDVQDFIALATQNHYEYALLSNQHTFVQRDGIIASFLEKAQYDMDTVSYTNKNEKVLKMYLHCPKDKQKEILPYLNHFSLAFEDDYELIEIRNKNHSKASGLKFILDTLNIKKENTYFFGDGYNDIEIFRYVGHPFVMGNANKDLYQYGTVCQSVYENGVYLKIKEILKEGNE